MKTYMKYSFLLTVLFLFFSFWGQAQVVGQNPLLFTAKNNGYASGVGKLPVQEGNLIGRLQFRGWVAGGNYHPGVEIRSVATGPVADDGYPANILFRTGYPDLDNRMAITAEGRVGIGTLNPDFDLHTIGNTHTTGDFFGRIHIDDTRSSDDAPATYDNEVYFELKEASAIGLPASVGEHGGLMTLSPGASSLDHQLFFTDAGLFTRHWEGEASDWGTAAWNKLLNAEDINGTPNRVAKFTGNSALSDSQIWDDGDQVGIGTETPLSDFFLDVNGATNIRGNAQVIGNTRIAGNLNVQNTLNLGYNGAYSIQHSIFGDLSIENQIGALRFTASGEEMMTISSDRVEIKKRVSVVGADLAERFNVRLPKGKGSLEPGMVLSIDTETPGGLVISQEAYDSKVAGIVSGAGGVHTAMLLGEEGTLADGDVSVALVGRVYCYVDARYGAIQPGDLLTTSSTYGHAMKVGDYQKSQGAILGKAMTSLEEGKGLVLVLISKQ